MSSSRNHFQSMLSPAEPSHQILSPLAIPAHRFTGTSSGSSEASPILRQSPYDLHHDMFAPPGSMPASASRYPSASASRYPSAAPSPSGSLIYSADISQRSSQQFPSHSSHNTSPVHSLNTSPVQQEFSSHEIQQAASCSGRDRSGSMLSRTSSLPAGFSFGAPTPPAAAAQGSSSAKAAIPFVVPRGEAGAKALTAPDLAVFFETVPGTHKRLCRFCVQ
jgi:hypothetical protein